MRAIGKQMPFVKGKSGNPGGRPKKRDDVVELARSYCPEAIERLAAWMRSDNPKAAVSAAVALLDRGWGKPHQASTVTIEKRSACDWSREELLALVQDAAEGRARGAPENGRGGKLN